jgi:hypothetical protein
MLLEISKFSLKFADKSYVWSFRDGGGRPMGHAKEVVRKLLKEIPDESSLEDIQYHIYVLEKVEKGLGDVKNKKVMSQAEARKRMSKWLEK